MIINPKQTFSDPFCRVKFYRPHGGTEINTQGSSFQEKWTKEIWGYIDSVEVVSQASNWSGIGTYQITLSAPLNIVKEWLDGKNGKGEWLKFGVVVGIVFGYQSGGREESIEFRGQVSFPELDLNPTNPTVTLNGPILGNITWGSLDGISGGESCKDTILKKMAQFGYDSSRVIMSSDFESNLLPVCFDTIPNGQSLIEFVKQSLPKMMKQVVETKSSGKRGGKEIEVDVSKYPSIRLDADKIIFDIKGVAEKPQIIFMFMGKYDLNPIQADSPQVVVVNNFRLPVKWSYMSHDKTSSVEGSIGDDKVAAPPQASTKGLKPATIPTPNREVEQLAAEQAKKDFEKIRYLAVDADVDTIGIPKLNVDDIVLFRNVGKLIDDGVWKIFVATHKWNKQGYTSSWKLHCINMEKAFDLRN